MDGAIVDLHLHWRSLCLGCFGPLDTRRRLDRVILRANFEQKWDVRFPTSGKTRTPCRVEGDSSAKITLRQIGRTSDAVWRNGEDHGPAAVGPAHHSDAFADDEGLGLQVSQRAIGVIRPLRPGSHAASAIRRHVARSETIGKQYGVSMRGQKLRPRCLARTE